MQTEHYKIENDIVVACIKASSFPAGVMQAFIQVHDKFKNRRYYGISRPEGNMNNIAYWAAAEALHPGEAADAGCDSMIIRKGNYTSIVITNFRDNMNAFGEAFQQLLSDPNIDQTAFCLEDYFNEKDVRCMVRLND